MIRLPFHRRRHQLQPFEGALRRLVLVVFDLIADHLPHQRRAPRDEIDAGRLDQDGALLFQGRRLIIGDLGSAHMNPAACRKGDRIGCLADDLYLLQQARAVLFHQHLADQRAEQAYIRTQRKVFFR